MTWNVKRRMFGSDVEFCEWMRNNKNLPSFSRDIGFVASDVDLFVHNYLCCIDGLGSREIQTLMAIEVKTRGGKPNKSQLDTLSKQHFTSFSKQCRRFGSEWIRNFGVSILSIDSTTPCNSQEMLWGRFDHNRIFWKTINLRLLESLLLSKIHPDTLEENPFRRHHKTKTVFTTVKTELGFSVQEKVIERS